MILLSLYEHERIIRGLGDYSYSPHTHPPDEAFGATNDLKVGLSVGRTAWQAVGQALCSDTAVTLSTPGGWISVQSRDRQTEPVMRYIIYKRDQQIIENIPLHHK